MKVDYLTLFPGMFGGVLDHSILKRTQDKGIINVNTINFRDYSINRHNQVNNYPFDGGQGMILKPEPAFNAMEDINHNEHTRVILMCPRSRPFTQEIVQELSETKHIVFICGHYEGYDERIRKHLVTDGTSAGDYVLTGEELPAMTITDAIVRLTPDVLGNQASHQNDLFSDGLLEFPQYTRPRGYKDMSIPEVLLSDSHAHIDQWGHERELIRTYERQPDLLEQYPLTEKDKGILETYKKKLRND